MSSWRLCVSALLLLSCASRQPAPPPASAQAARDRIEFVENDYARALAEARARRVPLFVDAWAPWCHTCLSMREYVFPDPAMQRFARRFVWLSMDTERDANAQTTERLAVHVLPTLFVIDPMTEKPVLSWPGSLTAPELAGLLEDAERAVQRGEPSAMLQGQVAIDALVTKLMTDHRSAECAATAADRAPHMQPGTALADVLRAGLSCAQDLPKDAPERARRLGDLATLGDRVAADLSQPILADDRSDLYNYVVSALPDLGRIDEAKRAAQSWAAFLEDRATHAPTPSARAVFDAHRVLAYIAIGEPQRAMPMLEQSARDFPSDYNPPARMANVLLEMKRYDDALAAVRRALSLAYGGRKLRLYSLEADILVAKGDSSAARQALAEALDYSKTLPLTGGYPKLRDAIEKRLGGLR